MTRHHLLFDRQEWSLRPEARRLRRTPSLIPILGSRAIHDELHANCPPVPLLDQHQLVNVERYFEPHENTLISINHLLEAIDTARRHPRAHPLERELADLASHAIELQIPYIKEGIV